MLPQFQNPVTPWVAGRVLSDPEERFNWFAHVFQWCTLSSFAIQNLLGVLHKKRIRSATYQGMRLRPAFALRSLELLGFQPPKLTAWRLFSQGFLRAFSLQNKLYEQKRNNSFGRKVNYHTDWFWWRFLFFPQKARVCSTQRRCILLWLSSRRWTLLDIERWEWLIRSNNRCRMMQRLLLCEGLSAL